MLSSWILALGLSGVLQTTTELWSVGKADQSSDEFALAPSQYDQFTNDPIYLVGRSKPKTDWPYVLPGPGDSWAGSRKHRFRVAFNLASAPQSKQVKLHVRFSDQHPTAPPTVGFFINGNGLGEKTLPQGSKTEAIFGKNPPRRANEVVLRISAQMLHVGMNQVDIVSQKGSWALFDSISLDSDLGMALGPVPSTAGRFSTPLLPVMVRKGKSASQTVTLDWNHQGAPRTAEALVDGQVVQQVPLTEGFSTMDIPIDRFAGKRTVECQLRIGSQIVAEDRVFVQPVRPWVVYLIPHSHVDIGYTDQQDNVLKKQWRNLERAIELARQTESNPEGSRFRWNAEVMWPMERYLASATPEKKQAMLEAIKKGWIGLSGLYGNELTGLCRPEELFELTRAAREVGALAGVKVDNAMISDVPGYSWGTVTTLAKSGVRYFSSGPNDSARIGSIYEYTGDQPFWWQGADPKDKVMLWTAGRGYYGMQSVGSGRGFAGWLAAYLGQLDQSGYPYDFVQVRCTHGGDNGGPDENLTSMVKDWNARYAYPKLVIATTSQMFKAFEAKYGSRIPVRRGDFTPYWEDGAGSTAVETALARNAADHIVWAEILAALRGIDLPASDVQSAWRNVMLFNEHTWGAFNSISEPDSDFVKDQWRVKKAFADDAQIESRKLVEKVSVSSGKTLTVYNPLSWARSGLVALPASVVTNQVTDVKTGKVYPVQPVGSKLLFQVDDLGGLESRTYRYESTTTFKSNAGAMLETLENSLYRLQVDPVSGTITSVLDKKANRELVDPKVGWNRYQYLLGERLADLKDSSGTQRTGMLTIPVVRRDSFKSDAPGCSSLTRDIDLFLGLPGILVTDTLNKLAVREKESVHIGFGFNVPGGVTRYSTGFGSVVTDKDQIDGSCKNWISVGRWVDVSNGEYGVTLVPLDAPLVEFGGVTANLLGNPDHPDWWVKKIGSTQSVYSWALNNHWNTNYKADQDGLITLRYALLPHGAFKAEDAERFAMEQAYPLVACLDSGSVVQPPFRLDSRQVLVTRLVRLSPSSLLVRLYNASDGVASGELKGLTRGARVFSTDLDGRGGKEISPRLRLRSKEVVTIRIDGGVRELVSK